MNGVDGGLSLRVSPTSAKSWIQRITIDRRRRDIGLGGHPAVPLARARLLVNANGAAVAAGLAPLAGERGARVAEASRLSIARPDGSQAANRVPTDC